VTIEEKQVTRDSYGGEVITWAEVVTCWAAVEPLQGREFLDGRRLEAEVSTRIRIRYRPGIKPGQRITWGDHVYDLEAVIEHESKRRELRLMCREWGVDR
jgi:SPP1 family predicted phage head-tail adaptor